MKKNTNNQSNIISIRNDTGISIGGTNKNELARKIDFTQPMVKIYASGLARANK